MKATIKNTLALLISIILFKISFCQKLTYQNPEKTINIIYDYKLTVDNADSSLLLHLKVMDWKNTTAYDYGSFELNKDNVHNNEALVEILKSRYQQAHKAYGKELILSHQSALFLMVQFIKDSIKQDQQYSYVYQGLNMFLTILNAAKRDLSNSGTVSFHVLDSYNVMLSSFGCTEDFIINIPKFKEYLIKRKARDKDNLGIEYYLGALENVNDNTLTSEQIHTILIDYFQGKWPPGTACGCCGNYSGPCLFWSYYCLQHDQACERCQWLLCFPGCHPSSCAGNSITLFFRF